MGRSQEMKLLFLLGLAFLIGLGVLLVKPDYRTAAILQSNADYYAETAPQVLTDDPVDESRSPMVEF